MSDAVVEWLKENEHRTRNTKGIFPQLPAFSTIVLL